MRDAYFLFVVMIAVICCTMTSVHSKEKPDYIKMPVTIQNKIEEHSFLRTNPQKDVVNFIGLCVQNDGVNSRVMNLFRNLSMESYSKYFASEEFFQFAKSKLGSVPRIIYPTDTDFYRTEYWKSHKFPQNSLVIFPEPDGVMLGFKCVDAKCPSGPFVLNPSLYGGLMAPC